MAERRPEIVEARKALEALGIEEMLRPFGFKSVVRYNRRNRVVELIVRYGISVEKYVSTVPAFLQMTPEERMARLEHLRESIQ